MLLLAEMEAQIEAQIRAQMLQALLVGMVPYLGLDYLLVDYLMVDCFLPHSVLQIQMILRDFHHSHFLRFGSYQSFREKCL